jgi:hypothetical protein
VPATHRCDIGAKRCGYLVEFFTTARKDVDEGALSDEALHGGEADAAGAAGDNGYLVLQS